MLWVLFAALWLAACQKPDIPDDIDDTPEFSVSFESDSSAQTLTAGLDGRYLFTSFDRDGFDVVTMRGAFADSHCPNADCPGTFTFEFRNFEPGAVVELDSGVIAPGFYAYKQSAGDTTVISHLQFSALTTAPDGNYFWKIYQQSQLVTESGAASFSHNFLNLTPLDIRLDYSSDNGFISSSTRNYLFDQSDCPGVSIIAVPDSLLAPNGYRLTAEVTSGPGAIQFQWNTGSVDSTFVVDSVSLTTVYAVTVTSSNGCTASALALNIGAGGEINESPGIVVERSDSISINDELQLGRVALQWIQPETGQILRSDLGQQPSDSYFQVLESAFYEPNENGEKTSWMRVQFRCRLFNADGFGMPFNGVATIAVAYP